MVQGRWPEIPIPCFRVVEKERKEEMKDTVSDLLLRLTLLENDLATYRADVEPVLRAAVDYEACEEFEVSDKQMALSDAIAASRVCQRIAREGK
jgi:hypothetical protein